MNKLDDSREQSLRYWGEEKCDDIVYTVYLKKVRYHHPVSSALNNDSEDEISHLEWETVRQRFIKSGSLLRLVESLGHLAIGDSDATYNSIFLSTFRAFSSPSEVLDLIRQRYGYLLSCKEERKYCEEQRRALRVAVMLWLDTYGTDFDQPPAFALLQRVINMCRQFVPETAELQIKAQHRLDKLKTEHNLARPLRKMSIADYEAETLDGEEMSSVSGSAYQNIPQRLADDSPEQRSVSKFVAIDERRFAQQLTRMDAELFRRVVPHQCLGSTWSKRKGVDASTVAATVDQFNAVSYCVISTILLLDTSQSKSVRCKLISKWIDIAQELRLLKNFSSLKAIISGLQSSSVYRLRHTWTLLARSKLEVFEELADIFSGDNNMLNQRQLLMKEGTAKHAVISHPAIAASISSASSNASSTSSSVVDRTVNLGTIPYLGTFLTDLMFVHMALPDFTSDGLINFDKRRKEFEILAQIRLLQGACSAYSFATDAEFERWFDSVLVLDDAEAHELSCLIEPVVQLTSVSSASSIDKHSSPITPNSRKFGGGSGGAVNATRRHHRKNNSLASVSSSSSAGAAVTTGECGLETTDSASRLSSGGVSGGGEAVSAQANERSPVVVNVSSPHGSIASLEGVSATSGMSGSSLARLASEAAAVASSRFISSRLLASSRSAASSSSWESCGGVSVASSSTSTGGAGGSFVKDKTKTSAASTSVSSSSISSTTAAITTSSSGGSGPETSPYINDSFYIIRVSMGSTGANTSGEGSGFNMYKSIMLNNNERTNQVIRNAMQKHDIDGCPEDYVLAQVLPDQDKPIPPNCNVYYAINTAHELNFVLLPKSRANSNGTHRPDGARAGGGTRGTAIGMLRRRLFS